MNSLRAMKEHLMLIMNSPAESKALSAASNIEDIFEIIQNRMSKEQKKCICKGVISPIVDSMVSSRSPVNVKRQACYAFISLITDCPENKQLVVKQCFSDLERIANCLPNTTDLELQYNYVQIIFRLTPRKSTEFLKKLFNDKANLRESFGKITGKTFNKDVKILLKEINKNFGSASFVVAECQKLALESDTNSDVFEDSFLVALNSNCVKMMLFGQPKSIFSWFPKSIFISRSGIEISLPDIKSYSSNCNQSDLKLYLEDPMEGGFDTIVLTIAGNNDNGSIEAEEANKDDKTMTKIIQNLTDNCLPVKPKRKVSVCSKPISFMDQEKGKIEVQGITEEKGQISEIARNNEEDGPLLPANPKITKFQSPSEFAVKPKTLLIDTSMLVNVPSPPAYSPIISSQVPDLDHKIVDNNYDYETMTTTTPTNTEETDSISSPNSIQLKRRLFRGRRFDLSSAKAHPYYYHPTSNRKRETNDEYSKDIKSLMASIGTCLIQAVKELDTEANANISILRKHIKDKIIRFYDQSASLRREFLDRLETAFKPVLRSCITPSITLTDIPDFNEEEIVGKTLSWIDSDINGMKDQANKLFMQCSRSVIQRK